MTPPRGRTGQEGQALSGEGGPALEDERRGERGAGALSAPESCRLLRRPERALLAIRSRSHSDACGREIVVSREVRAGEGRVPIHDRRGDSEPVGTHTCGSRFSAGIRRCLSDDADVLEAPAPNDAGFARGGLEPGRSAPRAKLLRAVLQLARGLRPRQRDGTDRLRGASLPKRWALQCGTTSSNSSSKRRTTGKASAITCGSSH